MLPMDFAQMYAPREREQRAMHLLDQVELAEHAQSSRGDFRGQQQRGDRPRPACRPPILVADEPTGNLDSKTADSSSSCLGAGRALEDDLDGSRTTAIWRNA